jgi:molybdate transport system substrate-binding protein
MQRHRIHLFALSVLASLSLPLLAPRPLWAAESARVRILVPNMLEGAFTELQPLLRARVAVPMDIEYIQMSKIADSLNKGEAADVAIMTKANIQPLTARGLVKSQVDVVQSELGIAVADGAPAPVLKTTDDLIAFLKATPSIGLFGGGASTAVLLQFAEKNGLAEVVKRKATIITEGYAGALVRDGKVASAMQQVSELKFGGANNVVPLPDALQTRPVSAVVVFANSTHPDIAAKIAQLLSSPEAAAAYRRAGLTPVISSARAPAQ